MVVTPAGVGDDPVLDSNGAQVSVSLAEEDVNLDVDFGLVMVTEEP